MKIISFIIQSIIYYAKLLSNFIWFFYDNFKQDEIIGKSSLLNIIGNIMQKSDVYQSLFFQDFIKESSKIEINTNEIFIIVSNIDNISSFDDKLEHVQLNYNIINYLEELSKKYCGKFSDKNVIDIYRQRMFNLYKQYLADFKNKNFNVNCSLINTIAFTKIILSLISDFIFLEIPLMRLYNQFKEIKSRYGYSFNDITDVSLKNIIMNKNKSQLIEDIKLLVDIKLFINKYVRSFNINLAITEKSFYEFYCEYLNSFFKNNKKRMILEYNSYMLDDTQIFTENTQLISEITQYFYKKIVNSAEKNNIISYCVQKFPSNIHLNVEESMLYANDFYDLSFLSNYFTNKCWDFNLTKTIGRYISYFHYTGVMFSYIFSFFEFTEFNFVLSDYLFSVFTFVFRFFFRKKLSFTNCKYNKLFENTIKFDIFLSKLFFNSDYIKTIDKITSLNIINHYTKINSPEKHEYKSIITQRLENTKMLSSCRSESLDLFGCPYKNYTFDFMYNI